MLDGQSYSTDVDGNGFIQRAWDSQGKPVSDAVLSNLNSSGTAYGTHAYTSTSKVYTIPKGDANAGQEYRERFNSQTGKFENVISTGPNAGQLYNGNPGLEKSVQTTLAKKEGTEAITLNYAGALSATRGGANAIGKFNAENGTNLAIPTYGPNRGRLVDMNNGGTVVTPDSQGNFNPVSNTTTTPTGNVGEDLSEGLRSKISSGNRTYDEQKKLYDQSVANGTPGKLPNGLPVAKPGGTTHETNNALDIPPAKLTQEDRRELAQKGYYQPFPNDPVHWERITTPSRAGGTTPPAAEKVSPASSTRTPKEPVFREAGHEQESPATFKARQGAWAEANKKVVGQESQKMYGAESIYDVAKTIQDTLPKATGSLIGSKVDQLASVFGYGTEGAKATAQLQVLGNRILMNVPRFEGPQSDRDTAVYKDAAGRIADPSVPIETRMAAFKTIMEINQKYAPELDWSFGKHSDVRKRADQIIGGK
jgi:hypothetical protein